MDETKEKKVAYNLTSDDLFRLVTVKLNEYEKSVEIKRNAILDLMKFVYLELEGRKNDNE